MTMKFGDIFRGAVKMIIRKSTRRPPVRLRELVNHPEYLLTLLKESKKDLFFSASSIS